MPGFVFSEFTQSPVGAGLPAMAAYHSTLRAADPPHSLASQLLQGQHFNIEGILWSGNPTSPSPPSSKTTAAS
ncbi:hypothetical protein EMIT0P218_110181 [Pseudomonas sp. IT-P218]